MKRIILVVALFCSLFTAQAQRNPFPSMDSLVKFTNIWVRNSAIDAFTALRLNTVLQGLARFTDSAFTFGARGVDSIYRTPGKDSIIYKINGIRYAIKDSTGGGSSGVSVDSIFRSPGKDSIIFTIAGRRHAIKDSTGSASGLTSLNGLTGSTQTFATGTSGTDFNISSTGTIHTFNGPDATSAHRGFLISTDWSTFNGKQAAGNYITGTTGDVLATGPGSVTATIQSSAVTTTKINNNAVTLAKQATNTANTLQGFDGSGNASDITLTTTGSSGAATISGGVLNIPQYSGGGSSTLTNFQVGFGDGSNALTGRTDFIYDSVLNSGTVYTKRLTVFAIPRPYGVKLTGLPVLNDQSFRVFGPIAVLGAPGYLQPTFWEYLSPYDSTTKDRMFNGWLGGQEWNEGYNLNYRAQTHRYYDSTKDIVYSYMGPSNGWGMQVVGKSHCNSCGDVYNQWGIIPVKYVLNKSGNDFVGADGFIRGKWNIVDPSATNQNLDSGRMATLGISGGALKLTGIPEFDIVDSAFVSMGGISDNQNLLSVSGDKAFGQVFKISDFENNSNDLRLYFERKKGSSFTLTTGTGMAKISANGVGFINFVASADHPSTFSSPDFNIKLQDAAGTIQQYFTMLHTGLIGINNTSPAKVLDIVSTTSGVLFPRMTTTQRNAMTPASWEIIVNTDSTSSPLEIYNGSAWLSIPGSGTGGGGGGSTPNWSAVLDQGGTLAANKHYNLGTHTIDFNHASGAGFAVRGVDPEIDLVDTINSLTHFVRGSGGYTEIGGSTGTAVKISKYMQTTDATDIDAGTGLNIGSLRAIAGSGNAMSNPFFVWNKSTTGSQFSVALNPALDNYAIYVANGGKVGVNTSTPDSALQVVGGIHAKRLRLDSLPGGVGTKALRYNPSDGKISYADTTTGSGIDSTTSDRIARRIAHDSLSSFGDLFTPSTTAGTNIASLSTGSGSYTFTRVGKIVEVTMKIPFTATSVSTGSNFTVAFPTGSGTTTFIAGVCNITDGTNYYSGVVAEAGFGASIAVSFNCGLITAGFVYIKCSYQHVDP